MHTYFHLISFWDDRPSPRFFLYFSPKICHLLGKVSNQFAPLFTLEVRFIRAQFKSLWIRNNDNMSSICFTEEVEGNASSFPPLYYPITILLHASLNQSYYTACSFPSRPQYVDFTYFYLQTLFRFSFCRKQLCHSVGIVWGKMICRFAGDPAEKYYKWRKNIPTTWYF